MSGALSLQQRVADVKDRVALADTIGRRVRLVRRGREHVGLCPFHKEKTPSFTVNEDKGFFHCFGCGAHGDVIGFEMCIDNLTFPEAVKRLSRETTATRARRPAPPCSGARAEDERRDTAGTAAALNIWRASPATRPAASRSGAKARQHHDGAGGADEQRRIAHARELWRRAAPAAGTLVDTYLRSRGITTPIPPTVRYLLDAKHAPTGLILPAMIVAVQGPNRTITAIHRTFLLPDGQRTARVNKPKMALGPIGNGAVRLAKAGPVLGLAEGIETALSAMQLFNVPCWAALGSTLDKIVLPEVVRQVVVYGDRGEAGLVAANKAVETFIGHR